MLVGGFNWYLKQVEISVIFSQGNSIIVFVFVSVVVVVVVVVVVLGLHRQICFANSIQNTLKLRPWLVYI